MKGLVLKQIPVFKKQCCAWGKKSVPAKLQIDLTLHADHYSTMHFQIPLQASGPVSLWAAVGGPGVIGNSEACGKFPAEWQTAYSWYFNVMSTKNDGPLEAYRLTFEHNSEHGRIQVISNKLQLLSCKPFLAIGTGLFSCSDISASNTPCKHIVGTSWSATVSEVKA